MLDVLHDPAIIIAEMRALLGDSYVLDAPEAMAPYLTDWRKRFTGSALCVVRPADTVEVSAVMRLASEKGLSIVPQGGNTGLVGGSVPIGNGYEIILSLARLNKIRELDAVSDVMVIEAGVTLMTAQEAAAEAGRLFPLSLASEGSATLGGAISTNAGGTAVLAYGTMRDLVVGLEVVLVDGRLWNGLGKLKKDNTGYDLKNLFIGSEGTLGIVTAAVVKVFPASKSRATAFCGLASVDEALKFFKLAKTDAGRELTTFELIPRLGIDLVLKHFSDTREPLFFQHPWYVLIEFSSLNEESADALSQRIILDAIDKAYIEDSVFAVTLAQRNDFWRLREYMPDAQTREGASIKHDISVSIDAIPAFIEAVLNDLIALIPDIRPFVFGHMGDGNLHFNLQAPEGADGQAFLKRADEVHEIVYRHIATFKGSISAEHGIGQVKRSLLAQTKDAVALDMMRTIKKALDPEGRLNPGKVL